MCIRDRYYIESFKNYWNAQKKQAWFNIDESWKSDKHKHISIIFSIIKIKLFSLIFYLNVQKSVNSNKLMTKEI